jgi:hypothetical protein
VLPAVTLQPLRVASDVLSEEVVRAGTGATERQVDDLSVREGSLPKGGPIRLPE